MAKFLLFLFAVFLLSLWLEFWAYESTDTAHARDSSVRAAFLKAHGLTKTPAGCQVDHLMPLMFNGDDALGNLCLVCGDRLIAKEKAERDLSDLEEWFKENADHPPDCILGRMSAMYRKDAVCECGLDDLRAALAQYKESTE